MRHLRGWLIYGYDTKSAESGAAFFGQMRTHNRTPLKAMLMLT